MHEDQLHLVIGCFGRQDSMDSAGSHTFISCPAVENRILKIDESLEYYDEMMNYMEVVRLFDRPMFDLNAIRHFLHNMQDRYDQKFKRLWSEKQYNLIERFILGHKICGTYVKLIIVNSEFEEKPKLPILKEKIIGTPIVEKANETPQFKLIRGRK